MTTQEWIDELKSISVLELSERIKALEEEFGVSATAVAAAAPAAAAGGDGAGPAEEEQTAFDVVLDGYEAARRVAVIRAVREGTGLGLKEARDAVDACPRAVREGLPRPEADKLRALLEAAGAQASIRPCAA